MFLPLIFAFPFALTIGFSAMLTAGVMADKRNMSDSQASRLMKASFATGLVGGEYVLALWVPKLWNALF